MVPSASATTSTRASLAEMTPSVRICWGTREVKDQIPTSSIATISATSAIQTRGLVLCTAESADEAGLSTCAPVRDGWATTTSPASLSVVTLDYQKIGVGFNDSSVRALSVQPSSTGTSYRRPGAKRGQKCR